MKKALLTPILFLILIPSLQAMQLRDNLYFAIPEETVTCIDITIPDDSGFMGKGEYQYKVECQPAETCWEWGSALTEEVIKTDENNTVRTSVCLNSFGKASGECSGPLTISISSPSLGISNSWDVGVCASEFPDVDLAELEEDPETSEDVREIINNNFDLFDMAFETSRKYAKPGEEVEFRLLVQSQAELVLDIETSGLETTPGSATLETLGGNSQQEQVFVLAAPDSPGSYTLKATARSRGCSISSCSKSAKAELQVSSGGEEDVSGFLVDIFPRSLNVKDLSTVLFKYTIQNFEKKRTFFVELNVTPDTLVAFRKESFEVWESSNKSVSFTVTPQEVSTLYEITLEVRSDQSIKRATAYLSTNEMLTDIIRERDDVFGEVNSSTRANLSREIDSWYSSYLDSDYGQGLDDYGDLQDALDSARLSPSEPKTNDTEPYTPPQTRDKQEPGLGNYTWIIIPIAAGVVLLLVFYYFRTSKSEETEYY